MLAPIRSSILTAARRGAPTTSSAILSRGMVTKAERWSHEDINEAKAALQSPDSPASKISLKDVVPHIEAKWAAMSKIEQYAVYRKLEELQRKDWHELSIDEKKAAYYVSFGPHGPRKPITEPGQAMKTAAGVGALVAISAAIFMTMRYFAPPPPKTMTKEYQEQMNQRAIEEKINPITGISSEGYKGKGFVQ